MEKINLEFKLAQDYLTAMHEHSGANKEDCQNVQMHLDNIYELIKNLNSPIITKGEALVCCANCEFICNEMTEKPCNECFTGHIKYKKRNGL